MYMYMNNDNLQIFIIIVYISKGDDELEGNVRIPYNVSSFLYVKLINVFDH
jgi:hypothetical protein